jgi:uncharacterized membrane protein
MPTDRKKPTNQKITLPAQNTPPKDSFQQVIIFVLFGLAIAVIFFWLFQTIYSTKYSATGIYMNFASQVISGQIPYRDFNLEYPPLALVFFILPRLLTDQWPSFSILYQLEVLIFAWLGLWVVYKIARRLGKEPWKLMAPYTLGILAIGPILGQQYDIFPAVMTLFSFYYFWMGQHKTSWLWLALGVMTKLYPAVFIPLYLIIYLRNGQIRPLVSGMVTFALACLVLLSPFLVTGPQNLISLVTYHSQRGIQIESLYGAFLLLADKLGLTSVSLGFSYGSWNLSGPLADKFSGLSTWIQAIGFFICYCFIWTQVKRGKSQFSRLGAYALLLTAVLLFTSKVFSPQYIIWLLPVLALIFTRWRWAIWTTFLVTGSFTYLIFPLNYLNLLNLDTSIIVILCLRDLTLILLAALAVVSLKTMKSSQ